MGLLMGADGRRLFDGVAVAWTLDILANPIPVTIIKTLQEEGADY
jgi:hypothetical protein